MSKSILVIGATGKLGKCLLHAASAHENKPELHAFVRTPENVTEDDNNLCKSVIQGDATEAKDIERALEESKAEYIVISLGAGDLKPQDVREKNAEAISEVIVKESRFKHVKVIAISSLGAGDSKIDIGFGMGSMVSYMLRHVLHDHTKQENILMKCNAEENAQVMVVRATRLTEDKGNGKVQMFPGNKKAPFGQVAREDVAKFVIDEICNSSVHFGKIIHITGDN